MRTSPDDRCSDTGGSAYRAVSGEVTRREIASSAALHMEELERASSSRTIDWLYRQPVATMMWMRKGFSRFELQVAGSTKRRIVVNGDSLLYLPPGTDAQGEFAVDRKCSYVAVFFPAEVAELAANEPIIGFDDPAVTDGLLDLRAWTDDPSFAIMAEGWTLQTAARLRRRSLEFVSAPTQAPDLDTSRLIEFLRYGDTTPTFGEMAQIAQMSREELMQALWREIKQTPFEYALKMRMEAAAALLRDTRLSVGDVARRFGYTSNVSFATAFRRVIGHSPTRHRAAATYGS